MSEPITHSETCRHCQHPGPHEVTLATSGIHYAKVTCSRCHKMLRWLTKPDSDPTKYKRPSQHLNLVADYSNGLCEMCLRTKEELPKNSTLVAHHVTEFKDGGSNQRDNIWIVCNACHTMIHWTRTYHGSVVLRNQVTETNLVPR